MRDYLGTVKRLYYKQDNPRKFNQSLFLNEIKGAMNYGVVVKIQEILKKSKDLNKEELEGELQIAIQESYAEVKSCLGLRIPDMKLEDFIGANDHIDTFDQRYSQGDTVDMVVVDSELVIQKSV